MAEADPKRPGPRLTWVLSAIIVTALLIGALASARPYLDEETGQLLVQAVATAARLDLYGSRCRSDASGRHTDNLNKELAGKLRMTVIEVQDDLFPEGSYRRVQERLQRDFFRELKEAGGCKGAKASGLPQQLKSRYDGLMQEIDALP